MDKMTVAVLTPIPFTDVLPTAKKHFRDAGFIVMYKDMYREFNETNHYDYYISTRKYKSIN